MFNLATVINVSNKYIKIQQLRDQLKKTHANRTSPQQIKKTSLSVSQHVLQILNRELHCKHSQCNQIQKCAEKSSKLDMLQLEKPHMRIEKKHQQIKTSV